MYRSKQKKSWTSLNQRVMARDRRNLRRQLMPSITHFKTDDQKTKLFGKARILHLGNESINHISNTIK